MEGNQAPKRPGGEMKGLSSTQPSKSQLLPFAANAMDLTTKPYFLPGLLVAILVPVLFNFIGDQATVSVTYKGVPVNVPMYIVMMAFILTAGGAFAIVRMVGKPKAWWMVPVVGALTGAFLSTPVWNVIKTVFSAGFGKDSPDGLLPSFLYNFIAVGFPEEIFKALMVFVGVWIGRKMITRTVANNPLRQLAVIEPLDGILVGCAAGLGFAFFETLFQYIPQTILERPNVGAALVAAALQNHVALSRDWYELFQNLIQSGAAFPRKLVVPLIGAIAEAKNGGVGLVLNTVAQATRANHGLGLELLIPRLVGDVTGHAAYSGIFGYFIGLAAMKPQNWIKTVLVGLGIAAGLHGLWDTVGDGVLGSGTIWFMLIAFASFAGLATLIMKAREISPNRSQLVASQIIDRMAAGLSRSQLVPQGFGGAPASAASNAASSVAARSSPVPARSITFDDGPDALVIEIGASRIPVAVGTRVYERQAPGTRASRGDSVIGEINANPREPDVVGIKNLSEQIWHVTTGEGERRELVPGRSVRLMRGMRVLIGDLVAEVR